MSGSHKRIAPRRVFSSFHAASARDAIGDLAPGVEVFGMTSGNFGLMDILAHVIDQAQATHCVLCTWTAAEKSVQEFLDMVRTAKLQSLRVIADPSLVTRKPEIADAMFAAYGGDSIRLVPLHAKWAVLTGGAVPVTLRTSMNLNHNKRIESFEISTCPDMAAYHVAIADDVFCTAPCLEAASRQSQSQRVLDAVQPNSKRPDQKLTLF